MSDQVHGLGEAPIKVEIQSEGSGDGLIEKFKQDKLLAMAPSERQAHEAAVLSVMGAVGRLGSLEVQRAQGLIMTAEQDAEYQRLLAWWNHIGPTSQETVARKATELSMYVFDLWRFF